MKGNSIGRIRTEIAGRVRAFGNYAQVLGRLTISGKVKDAALGVIPLWTLRKAVASALVNLSPEEFSIKGLPLKTRLNLADVVLDVETKEEIIGTHEYETFIENIIKRSISVSLTQASVEFEAGGSTKGVTFPLDFFTKFDEFCVKREEIK